MKKIYLLILISIGTCFFAQSQDYTISTIGGTGTAGYSGDGGAATAAEMHSPWGVAVDKACNVYAAEYGNCIIRKITTNGIISTVAGMPNANGFYGDGGQATAAELNFPTGVAIDSLANIYIADNTNNRVRKVNALGIMSTFAGNGTGSFSGDGGAATAAEINVASGVATDTHGNVFIADFYGFRVRKVNSGGTISTVAGNGGYGFSGDGTPATSASIKSFIGVAVDKTGNIYIADQGNARVRKVNTNGIISTFAGNGSQNFSGDGGAASTAELNYPYGVGTDMTGNVFIADYANERIRFVNTIGIINTVAGNGTNSYYGDGGPATAAEISAISGVAIDSKGNVYIADQMNNVIRKLTPIIHEGVQSISDANQLKIFPNPGTGKFTVLLNSSKSDKYFAVMEFYNISGEKVSTDTLQNNQGENFIDLSNQPDGVYIYKVIDEDQKIIGEGKILLQR